MMARNNLLNFGNPHQPSFYDKNDATPRMSDHSDAGTGKQKWADKSEPGSMSRNSPAYLEYNN